MGTAADVHTRAAASASPRRFMARSSSMTVPDGLAVAFTSATVAGESPEQAETASTAHQRAEPNSRVLIASRTLMQGA